MLRFEWSGLLNNLVQIGLTVSAAALVLFLLLITRLLRVEHIQEKADFLLANMAFFFLPAGVSIMNYFDLLRSSAVALVVICLVTTVVTFAATAWSIRLTLRLLERRKNRV